MLCYYLDNEKKENSIELSPDEYISLYDCSGQALSEGEELINLWRIKEIEFWECEPRSDAGIYDKKTTSFEHEITFTNLVFDGCAFVGVYITSINKILYFNKGGITVIKNSKFVGGWGDITEGMVYSFIKNE